MRGDDTLQGPLFSYVDLETRVPKDHPLRPIRSLVDEILQKLDGEFSAIYSNIGRPSIPPERLFRASLIQILYSIRSERQLMEQLDYNLLFRWFVGLGIDDPVWVPTVFTKNRNRLIQGEISVRFFEEVLSIAEANSLVSHDHFTVDGTLLEAWAGIKSFKRKDDDESNPPPEDGGRNPTRNFKGQKLKNSTHQSTSDPDSRLAKKSAGGEAKLSYAGHILTENRNGLVVRSVVTRATGTAERTAATEMVGSIEGRHRITLGADKGYDAKDFVANIRELCATPHVAQKKSGWTNIDERTTRHEGYRMSQRKRKRVEEVFGWAKTIGPLRKLKHRGLSIVNEIFKLTMATYNLVRIRNLTMACPI